MTNVSVSSAKALAARFHRSRSGLAAVEFALIAPIMVFMFFAVVEGSDALSTSRRVDLAANTLADLTAQETQITADDASDLFKGVKQIIGDTTTTADYRIVSVIRDPDTDEVIVDWSRDSNGTAPYAKGSVYPGPVEAALIADAASLIVSEVRYAYRPPISRVLALEIDFERTSTRWPRRAFRVEFCATSTNCS
ncbi:MAG: TadE/TadG family type IV pilus assembly protein [Pseudomonadota bacterium]